MDNKKDNRKLPYLPLPLLDEVHSANPHLFGRVVVEGAGAARLTLHLYQTAVEEPFVEMGAGEGTRPGEGHAVGVRRRIGCGESHPRPGRVPPPQRGLGARRWRGDRRRREPGRRGGRGDRRGRRSGSGRRRRSRRRRRRRRGRRRGSRRRRRRRRRQRGSRRRRGRRRCQRRRRRCRRRGGDRGGSGLTLRLRDARPARIRFLIDPFRARFLGGRWTRCFRGGAFVPVLGFFRLRRVVLVALYGILGARRVRVFCWNKREKERASQTRTAGDR